MEGSISPCKALPETFSTCKVPPTKSSTGTVPVNRLLPNEKINNAKLEKLVGIVPKHVDMTKKKVYKKESKIKTMCSPEMWFPSRLNPCITAFS